MTPLLLALLVAAPSTPADRLAAFIVRRQPEAKPYAAELAQRIFVEGKRRSIPPEVMAAIGWIESDYRRGLRGAKGEIGLWQLGATRGDHRIPQAWHELTRAAEFADWPIVKRLGSRPWSALRKRQREAVLDDVRAGTYIVGLELWSVRRTCYRMRARGHVSGGVKWRRSNWYRHRGPDVYAHYNSGVRPPRVGYLRKLRRRSKIIRRVLAR
jgi:hypothetical protein